MITGSILVNDIPKENNLVAVNAFTESLIFKTILPMIEHNDKIYSNFEYYLEVK